MEALFAGFVAGAGVGVLSLWVFARALAARPDAVDGLLRGLPEGVSLPVLTAGLAVAGQALWSLVGLILGAIYWLVRDDAQDGLGSPAWGFTLTMVLLVGAAAVLGASIWPSAWRRVAVVALLAAGLFGWLLPHLAEA